MYLIIMATIYTYKDLVVWQKAMDLALSIYTVSASFPREEMYGLTAQLRRASISIPSNIAEGRHRGSRKDFVHFLRVAYASGAEVETQLLLAHRLFVLPAKEYEQTLALHTQVMKMLNAMIKKLFPSIGKAEEA